MSGTKAGARKMVETLRQRDPDYFKKIGEKGGKNSHAGGFANRERAAYWGRINGRLSPIAKRQQLSDNEATTSEC